MSDLAVLKYELAEVENDRGVIELDERDALTMSNLMPDVLGLLSPFLKRAMTERPKVEIEYCTQCRWLLRAGWTAQELLLTFEDELGGVMLVPGTGGIFEVRLGPEVVWSRKAEGRFPELKELKQRLRDRIAPGRDLGHSDPPAEKL